MRPEETHGFTGLYGEVVTLDSYGIKTLDFTPDVVFDIGANIGVFSRFVRKLFPAVKIVAVEPDEFNWKILIEHTQHDNIVFVNAAIGNGSVYRMLGAVCGTHEVYMTECPGYALEDLDGLMRDGSAVVANIPAVRLSELVSEHLRAGQKCIIKIDGEGCENSIFAHEPSLLALHSADYICMEVHGFGVNSGEANKQYVRQEAAMRSFEATHECRRDRDITVGGLFMARKRHK